MDFELTEDDFIRAERNGLSRKTVLGRFRSGWDIERAVTQPMSDRKYSKELIEKAASNGIKYTTLVKRLRQGMSEEEAATKPVFANRFTEKEQQFLLENSDKYTIKQIAEMLGRPYGTILSQRRKLGLSEKRRG